MQLLGQNLAIASAGPRVTISGPDGGAQIGQDAVQFYASSPDQITSLTCSVDGQAAEDCPGNGVSYINYAWMLSTGVHSLTITATGPTGSTTVPARTFEIVDAPQPQISNISYGQRFDTASGLTLAWNNTGGPISSASCYVYNGAYTNWDYQERDCTSPIDLSDMTDGQVSFYMVADGPGGQGYADVYFYVGAQPTVTIDDSSVVVDGDSVTAQFTTEHAAYVYCYAHNDGWSYNQQLGPDCASPVSFSGLQGGYITLEIYAYDASWSSSGTDSVRFYITPVPTSVDINEAGITTTDGNVSVPFTKSGATYAYCTLHDASYSYYVQSGPYCTSPATFNNVPAGTYTFDVQVYDSTWSQYASDSAQVNVVSTVPPVVTINQPAEGQSVSAADPAFSYTVNVAPTAVQCTLDGNALPCGSNTAQSYSGTLGDLTPGPHTLVVTATNEYGSRPTTRNFTAVEAPKVTITSGPANGDSLRVSKINVSYTVTGTATSVSCTLNGQNLPSCGGVTGGSFYAPQNVSPYGYRWLRTDVPNTYSVTATNSSGMSSTVTRTFNVIYDPIVTNVDGITHHQHPTNFYSTYMTSYEVAGGKIMVAGQYQTLKNLNTFPDLSEKGLLFTRLNSDMTLDTSYGTNGEKRFSLGNYDSQISALQEPLAISHDDASGYTYYVMSKYSDNRDHLVRFDAAGNYDTSFGNPVVPTNRGNPDYHTYIWPVSVKPLADGHLALAGYGENSVVVTMLNADGSVDTNYGTGGQATLASATCHPSADLTQDASGRLLVGVSCSYSASYASYLYRLNTDGSVDGSFGPTQFGSFNVPKRVDVAADGTITVAGHETYSAFMATVSDGGVKLSQSSLFSGKFVAAAENQSVTRDAQGRYVFAAQNSASNCYPCSSTVGRANADGTPDATFGTAGDGSMTLTKLAMAPYAVNETQEQAQIEGVLALTDGRTAVYGWQGQQMTMRDVLADGSGPVGG
jgi:uncharacterized delta-60 repeat protein